MGIQDTSFTPGLLIDPARKHSTMQENVVQLYQYTLTLDYDTMLYYT